MAWLSASLFLLPVMKLRVVRGMMVEGDEGGNVNGIGDFVWGWEGRQGEESGSMIMAASLA